MPEEIRISTLKANFKEAIAKIYQDDYSLITRKCSERSIVFRLGLYLANSFMDCGVDVDCEYNKNGDRPKALREKPFTYPDIIVHEREINEHNFLIVEVKTPNDTRSADFRNDVDKLMGFTCDASYVYRLGVHVYISAASCSLVWYEAGEIRERCRYRVDKNTRELLEIHPSGSQRENAFDQWYNDNFRDSLSE